MLCEHFQEVGGGYLVRSRAFTELRVRGYASPIAPVALAALATMCTQHTITDANRNVRLSEENENGILTRKLKLLRFRCLNDY